MSIYPTVPLTDVAWFQEGPGILAKDFTSEGVPLVRLSGLGGHEVTLRGCNYVSTENGSSKWAHFRLEQGDVLVSTSASFGRPAVVGGEANGALFYTGLIRFRSKSPDLDEGYLKTFLGSRLFMRQADAMASGSVIQHFGPSHLRKMHVHLPPLSTQQAIAAIHAALDDKVQSNRRLNEALLDAARMVFRDWFVDFGPVRARAAQSAPYLPSEVWSLFPQSFNTEVIPQGWRKSNIGGEVALVGGTTPSTKKAEYWGGTHPWATPKDLSGLEAPILRATERKLTDSGLAQIGSGLLPTGSVLLSSRAPIGYLAITRMPTAINQGFIGLVCSGKISNAHALLWCDCNRELIVQNANGSTFLEISKRNFRPLEIVVANDKILRAFDQFVSPMFERISAYVEEVASLSAMRDALLPRLMSGELRVGEAERIIAEAA